MTDQPNNPGVERPSDEDTAAVVGEMGTQHKETT